MRVRVKFCDGAEKIRFLKEKTEEVLKMRNIILEESDNPELVIYSIGNKGEFLQYDCTKIFYTEENLRPDFNLCDYAAEFSNIQYDDRYLRIPNYYFYTEDWEKAKVKHKLNWTKESIQERQFCNFIYSNSSAKYRGEFFDMLSNYKSVASGGQFRNNIGKIIENKYEFQKEFKFSIAFENASYPYYTTKKILQAFAAGTIPIYYGNPLVDKEFNPKSFINCNDFNNDFQRVINRIIEIDNNDELYLSILREPAFQEGMPDNPIEIWGDFLENIINNLRSGRKVSQEYWANRYLRRQESYYGFFHFSSKIKLFERAMHWYYKRQQKK